MLKRILLLLVVVTGSFLPASAQVPFTFWDSIPVVQWGDTLKYAFAGGFNNPQFSTIDLNGDGVEDLFVFERSTNKIYPFINTGLAGQSSYVYAPQYLKNFPPELNGWVLLRDYNCDGKKDIFTAKDNSFAVYRNDYSAGTGLRFTLAKVFDQNTFYIISADIPAISDVDDDGDLDLLTFDVPGMYMYYFKNLSKENYGTCDSLSFTLAEHCWGSFSENFFSCDILLGDTLSPCRMHNGPHREMQEEGATKETRHPGNTELLLDVNGDGKKDMILGPQVCSKAILLTNCTVPVSVDSMVRQDLFYPDTIHPVDFSLFPATFYEDVNNDGRKDLLAAPNRSASEDTASSWLYTDTGSTARLKFDFQKKNFLQGDMIDVGEGANPVFFDDDGDSLQDLVIGNEMYYSVTFPNPSGLALYKNTGTRQSPAFRLVTRDYANLMALGLNGIYPAFGDLDADGDVDMMVGEESGHLYYFKNTAGAGNPSVFTLSAANYDTIDVGQFAAPQLVDVNCDGLLDMLVGERSGTIKYFQNTGTDSTPVFSRTPTNSEFGGIDVLPVCCTGYAVPFLTTDSLGHFQLLVGTESDSIYSYTNIDNNLEGTFQLSDVVYSGINEGTRATVSGADLNDDGKMDLVVGNLAGGVTLFKGSVARVGKDCTPPVEVPPLSITAYPNPVLQTESFYLDIRGLSQSDYAEITMWNVIGQKIYSSKPSAQTGNRIVSIPVSGYSAGLYILKVTIPGKPGVGGFIRKVIISN